MKLKICVVLLLIVSALLAQTKNEFPLHKQAFQVSYLLDFDSDFEELLFFSYKIHTKNNYVHKIGINIFYELNRNEDKKRLDENIKLNNGFSLSYSFLHYSQIENFVRFYYGIGLMGKYSYQEDKEIVYRGSYDIITTDFQKKWSPIFFPCFGFEFAFSKSFSINLENSLVFGYSNEIFKIRHTTHDDLSYLEDHKKNEDYYFKPVNINIGMNYYF